MAITDILVRLSFRANFVTSNLSETSPRRAKEPSDSFSGEPGSAGAPGCQRYQNSKLEMDGVQDLTCKDFKDFPQMSRQLEQVAPFYSLLLTLCARFAERTIQATIEEEILCREPVHQNFQVTPSPRHLRSQLLGLTPNGGSSFLAGKGAQLDKSNCQLRPQEMARKARHAPLQL